MATYKKRKVEGTIYGKTMQGIASDYVNRGTKPNRGEWNEVDNSWFTYWVGRAELSRDNNERLDAIDEAFLDKQNAKIGQKEQAENNAKATEVAKELGIDPTKLAAFMQMMGK